ncbi:hypothetical protein BCR33DRAFT_717846 [Rhizoclosmatium globosum]|uniref:Uncharacterized protein n=1 Tax=Rhizoclosmatium globosum TaxID=329046 RepID=A0A1Y2C7V3_9FUNG|nr:hypothetical protein BCR33DRAFT_717846 [Rhizoclosmatium globosum]|eukprot:ORY43111.1 hypothetical protein BCR33DRAFT_717846 [Rhizoclosmatium globosum]
MSWFLLSFLFSFVVTIYVKRLQFYHAFMNWQLGSELSQTPYNEPPVLELVVARAMAATKLDTFNLDNSNDRSDFALNIKSALDDAWNAGNPSQPSSGDVTTANNQQSQQPRKRVYGVFRKFVLDCVTQDLSRRMKLVDAFVNDPLLLAVKIPDLVIITSATPFSGAEKIVEYLKTKDNKFHAPSLSDIKNIVPTSSVSSPPPKTVPHSAPPFKPEYDVLLKNFTNSAEISGPLSPSNFRVGHSAYLNCTFHDLHAFQRLPLPTLQSTPRTIQTVNLLKLLLQLHTSHLTTPPPPYIVLEGHEHVEYLHLLASVFPSVRVVVVESTHEQVEVKVREQVSTVRRIVMGVVEDVDVKSLIEAEKVKIDVGCASLGAGKVLRVDGSGLVNVTAEGVANSGKRGVVEVLGDRIIDWLEG